MKEKALEQKAEEKKYLVNCMNCGAALRVKGKADDYVYVCPACNNRFRVRIGKEVKDETSVSEEK